MAKQQVRVGAYARQSKDSTKSISEQLAEILADVAEQGWADPVRYSDGVSASRFGTKARPDWDRLLADIAAGEIDVLVLWETSRGDRDLPTWATLLATCRRQGVRIRVTSHERTYNLTIPSDWKNLATDGIDSAYESEKTSLRMLRAMAAQAREGKPTSRCVYGYERVYGIDDKGKRVLVEQRPHPVHAPIVAEIVRRVAAPESLLSIARDLNARGVPPPSAARPTGKETPAARWSYNTVSDIAGRVDYTGLREYRGETYDAVWPAIVADKDHLAARRILTDPARKTSRPSRQRWLLSYLARCGAKDCGEYLHRVPARRGMTARYECNDGCLRIQADELDELVTVAVVDRLAEEKEFDVSAPSDEAAVLTAHATVETLQTRLDEWRKSARKGETSPASLASIEAGLLADMAAVKKAAAVATVPAILIDLLDGVYGRADLIGDRFAALPVTAQRELIGRYLDVSIGPATVRVRSDAPLERSRVRATWKR